MSVRIALRHITRYKFDRPVNLSPHILRLRPAPHCRTPIRGYTLQITPQENFLNWQQDPFGNWLARLVFPKPGRELLIDVELIADMTRINPFDFFIDEVAEHYPFSYPPALAQELAPYLEIDERGRRLRQWVKSVNTARRHTVDFLVELNQRLQRDIAYTIRMEPGVQSCEDTLALGSGSCRDSAWLLVQIARHLGLAARFVSGYLVQLVADEKPLDGPAGTSHDFTDLHAWAEIYVPGAGWIGLDPTSGLFAAEGHIPLAAAPRPASAAPIEGKTDVCEVQFEFGNHVTRLQETVRVTKPFSDEQWLRIDGLGQEVDRRLQAQGVRLTMGGEPTFVSMDDMEGPEWNTGALGAQKRRLAEDLWLRLQRRFAPGGLLHAGQGKWYPGEPLPRWALGIYWRRDGLPLWHDVGLIADQHKDLGHDADTAARFITALAASLRLQAGFVRAGYEDALYCLWQEARLPDNITAADLDDDQQRQMLANILSRGLEQAVGYALPLQWDWRQSRLTSGPWRFRRERMYLLPGDSPMGLRLPLDSLPWQAPAAREIEPEADPFAAQPPLADDFRKFACSEDSAVAADAADAGGSVVVPHTAICVEARGGVLHIFMPPLQILEHYLTLLSAVENCAQRLHLPVVIEGYPPPRDPRLQQLQVTPDPGVIEVNVQPAESWDDLVNIIETLYAEARQSRLATEKFMLDGRHTGTGGGNHVTLGGATADDSPWLRRPQLLQSVLTFWQHHPSLSYLFSGLFIGPTSQAPRVDEGRRDQLHELQIAFAQTPLGEVQQPWLIDRILRHLLVDVSGNTHRAEICIDKLYSPDSAAGRQGLVEFRGMEMPPHARMSLLQMLLLRGLVLSFWEQPYTHPLVDWGTQLHDRFMLPHYLWEDFAEVLRHLRDAGMNFEREWFTPFAEFRFPRYGSARVADMEIELRAAIEPWYVLGEEMSNQGTARFVDSSVERLQVRLSNLTPSRYVFTCNGRRVPLHHTGVQGEYVAGVRYRAWQPPSALHPTIAVHAPLVFDLYDTWNRRSIGGCTYRVMHGGGRNYETYPVNSYEAESRRIARFSEWGHTPPARHSLIAAGAPPLPVADREGSVTAHGTGDTHWPREEAPTAEFPCTLDLRRPPL